MSVTVTSTPIAVTVQDQLVAVSPSTNAVQVTVSGGPTGATGPTGPRGLSGLASGNLPFINVQDAPYSATGNGSTNDTAALKAAFAAAVVAGDPVYIPAGTYMVDSVTSLANTIAFSGTVVGAGYDKTIIKVIAATVVGPDGNTTGPELAKSNRVIQVMAGATISGITIDGNNVAIAAIWGESTAGAATGAAGNEDSAVTMVTVDDDQHDVTFEACRFMNQWSRGRFDTATWGADNLGAEGFALVVKACDNFVARGCVFEWNSGSGVATNSTTVDSSAPVTSPLTKKKTRFAQFIDCIADNNGYQSDRVTARDATIGGKGMASSNATDIVVSGGRYENNVEMGVNFEETLRATVSNALIKDNGEAGVAARGYIHTLQIQGCRLINNGRLSTGLTGDSKRFGSITVSYSSSEYPRGIAQNIYVQDTVIVDSGTTRSATFAIATDTVVDSGTVFPTIYTNNPDVDTWTWTSKTDAGLFVDAAMNATLRLSPAFPSGLKKVQKGTLSVAPGIVPGNSRVAIAVTLTGLAAGDVLTLHFPTAAPANGLIYGGHTVATNTVTVYFANVTTGSITNNTALNWPYEWHDYT